MIGVNRDGPFERELVAITPGELAILPVEICAVSVEDQKSCCQGKVSGYRHQKPIFGSGIRSSDVSVSSLKHKWSGLGVVRVVGSDSFKFEQGFEVKLDTRSQRGLGWIAAFSIVFCLEISTNH